MTYFRQLKTLVWKDVTSEMRTKEMLSAMVIFSFLVIVIFSFAFDPTRDTTKAVFPGVIWVAFAFSAILGLNRSFIVEKQNDALLGLMLCPADRSVIYYAKVVSNLLFVTTMELISLPIFFILFNHPLPDSIGLLLMVVFLGTLGFIGVGTLLAALAANTKTSEILLPIILFPMVVPIIIAAVASTAIILGEPSTIELKAWLGLMIAYDVVFLTLPFVLFEYVLEV